MSLKILLAVDGSLYSDMAVDTIKAFCFPSGTEIKVITVVPDHIFLGGITLHSLRKGMVSRESIKRAEEEKASALLGKIRQALGTDGIKVDSTLYRGNPARVIIEQAHNLQANLVVIGAKGTGNSRRFRLGSTAHSVMRHSDSSVLVVRERTEKIRSVIFATDGSRHADAAVGFLLNLSIPNNSRFIVVTVLQSYIGNIDTLAKMGISEADSDEKSLMAELRKAEEQAAREIVQKAGHRFQQNGYETSFSVMRGDPAEKIIRISNTRYPDLIVLGAKGLHESDSFLMGSVAQRVARSANYSVLITREY